MVQTVYFSKCRNGQERRGGDRLRERRKEVLRTFTVYKDLGAIAVGTHQYSGIVYLLVCQAGLAIDDFKELERQVSQDS